MFPGIFCARNLNYIPPRFFFLYFRAVHPNCCGMEIVHNEQSKLALDFVQYTNKHVFLTGNAGTGKTTFLKYLKTVSPKRMIVVAPTGVAAINAGGVTIHSFFQLPFGPFIPGLERKDSDESGRESSRRFSREKINIIRSLDLLVIDEISMVRSDLLDGIDEVLKRFRHSRQPFAGVQLLMIGDLQQLAPVVKEDEWELLRHHYDSVFFFGSRALQAADFVSIELKTIYRQTDRHFINMLNRVRNNELDANILDELNRRYDPSATPGEGYVTLTTHNYQAKNINERELQNLDNKPYTFEATVNGDFPEYMFPTEKMLVLKVGAQVMFVKNDISPARLYFNGKIGQITTIDNRQIYVRCDDAEDEIVVSPVQWENTKYTINEETKQIVETVAGTFSQYPLRLAWALTIHKSQGLTFDKVIIDAGAAFAHGQVYVALSRCRTLEGLTLCSRISRQCVISSGEVSGFISHVAANEPDQRQLGEAKQAYQQMLIRGLFDFIPLSKLLGRCLKVTNEHRASLIGSLPDALRSLATAIEEQLVVVGQRFDNQLSQLFSLSRELETNEPLQERVKKAANYFTGSLNRLMSSETSGLHFDTDNKAAKKAVSEALEALREWVRLSVASLETCKTGFSVSRLLEARAKAVLNTTKEKQSSNKAAGAVYVNEAKYPALYKELRAWRDQKAEELDTDVFMIVPQKTLVLLATLVPVTTLELLAVKGMGKKKVKQFGSEILSIIARYADANSLPRIAAVVEVLPKAEKSAVSNTKLRSFELFRSGKTIPEVAAERGLAVSTIESHLVHYVRLGDIALQDVVPPQKAQVMLDYFSRNTQASLSMAREELGDAFSFAELRFAKEHLASSDALNS